MCAHGGACAAVLGWAGAYPPGAYRPCSARNFGELCKSEVQLPSMRLPRRWINPALPRPIAPTLTLTAGAQIDPTRAVFHLQTNVWSTITVPVDAGAIGAGYSVVLYQVLLNSVAHHAAFGHQW